MSGEREIRRPVRPALVFLRCAKCPDGMMYAAGFSRPTSPPLYGHTCDKCGTTEWISDKRYPHLEYGEERGFGT
jgi:hypothetical protein